MNENPHDRELPELNDDQIVLLDSICKAASRSVEAPFRALTAEYDAELQERGLDSSRDNAVFRYIMRVGESARRAYRVGRSTDYVRYLRAILESQGITVIDDDDNNGDIDGVTRSLELHPGPARPAQQSDSRRRSSFDDARLEETWLSQRSLFADNNTNVHARATLEQPQRRTDDFRSQRSKSADSENLLGGRQPAPQQAQRASQFSQHPSDDEETRGPDLLFDPSQTQLERNAEAFLQTSDTRWARNCLYQWHVETERRQQLSANANHHFCHNLLKDAFVAWNDVFSARRTERQWLADIEREERNHIVRLEEVLQNRRLEQHRLLGRSFTNWYHVAVRSKQLTSLARQFIMKGGYFRRWRRLTTENAVKARSIVFRKCLAKWRAALSRRLLVHEQANAEREEYLQRKFLRKWHWLAYTKRVEAGHQKRIENNTLRVLFALLQRHRTQERQADEFRYRRLAGSAFLKLAQRSQQLKQNSVSAEDHYYGRMASDCILKLHIHAKLTTPAATISMRINIDLKRKYLQKWNLHFTNIRRAAEFQRTHIIRSAWTAWKDHIRCQVLSRFIDGRVLAESLYKWQLQGRLQWFRRERDRKALLCKFRDWSEKVQQKRTALEQASAIFAAGQRWRQLRYGMLQLNISVRRREDAERAAIEFSNSLTIPDILSAWKRRTEHAGKLAKWASDARFYILCTRTLKAWSERTIEHKHERRREAYAQVRSRIKIRIARNCLMALRSKTMKNEARLRQAEIHRQEHIFKLGVKAFHQWRSKATQCADFEVQALAQDQQKLLTSAISALINHNAHLASMEQEALLHRQQSDLALVSRVLRNAQWITFTSARRIESADALWARTRVQHVKLMLRHWASQAATRRSARSLPEQEPDSPSLRPASRVASRPASFTSSPPNQATPGYMRTPPRSRRTGRFRPLPTPAHVTPMAFNGSYFVTTPAPLGIAQTYGTEQPEGDADNVFDALAPQITPFSRKLRAGGITPAPQPSALRTSVMGRSFAGAGGGGTSKSVRFAGPGGFSGPDQSRLDTADE